MEKNEKLHSVVKNLFAKKYNLREGIVDYIFGKVMVKKLSNDKDFIEMAKKLDNDMAKLREKLLQLKKAGKPIPKYYQQLIDKN